MSVLAKTKWSQIRQYEWQCADNGKCAEKQRANNFWALFNSVLHAKDMDLKMHEASRISSKCAFLISDL